MAVKGNKGTKDRKVLRQRQEAKGPRRKILRYNQKAKEQREEKVLFQRQETMQLNRRRKGTVTETRNKRAETGKEQRPEKVLCQRLGKRPEKRLCQRQETD